MIAWDRLWFEYLPPLCGDFAPRSPTTADSLYAEAIQRARQLIRHRTQDEINVLITLIDTIWELPEQRYFNLERYSEDLPTTKQLDIHVGPDSSLCFLVDSYTLDSPLIESPRWSECFALMAINCAGETLADLEYHTNHPLSDDSAQEHYLLDIATFTLAPVQECLSLAEILRTEEVLTGPRMALKNNSSDSLGLHAKHAATMRHEPAQKLKLQFVKWYLDPENRQRYPSRNQAALAFHNQLDIEEKRITRNPSRFFMDALRAAEARHPKLFGD
jgi:hypothetical protein